MANSDREDVAADDADGRSRRKNSIFPSESGSEADDESSGFLKGLPAPPMIPRKGLRGAGQENGSSPMATPKLLSGSNRSLSAEFRSWKEDWSGTKQQSIGDVQRKAELFRKRRRAESLRRVTEVALVASLGWLIVRDQDVWLQMKSLYRGIPCTSIGIMCSAAKNPSSRVPEPVRGGCVVAWVLPRTTAVPCLEAHERWTNRPWRFVPYTILI